MCDAPVSAPWLMAAPRKWLRIEVERRLHLVDRRPAVPAGLTVNRSRSTVGGAGVDHVA